MKTVLAREPQRRFTLIYGNRALQSTMFKEEIEDLKNRYMTRLVAAPRVLATSTPTRRSTAA